MTTDILYHTLHLRKPENLPNVKKGLPADKTIKCGGLHSIKECKGDIDTNRKDGEKEGGKNVLGSSGGSLREQWWLIWEEWWLIGSDTRL
jgi:hypothetical protein